MASSMGAPLYPTAQPQSSVPGLTTSGADEYYREAARRLREQSEAENNPLKMILAAIDFLTKYGGPDAQMAGRAAAGPYGLQQMYNKMGLNSITQGLMQDATSAFAPGSALNQDPRYAGQQYGIAQLLAAQGAANEAMGSYDKYRTAPEHAWQGLRPLAVGGLTPWQQEIAANYARRNAMGIREADPGWSLGSTGRNRGAYGPDGTFYPSGETFG